jgi:hypothetical protein
MLQLGGTTVDSRGARLVRRHYPLTVVVNEITHLSRSSLPEGENGTPLATGSTLLLLLQLQYSVFVVNKG